VFATLLHRSSSINQYRSGKGNQQENKPNMMESNRGDQDRMAGKSLVCFYLIPLSQTYHIRLFSITEYDGAQIYRRPIHRIAFFHYQKKKVLIVIAAIFSGLCYFLGWQLLNDVIFAELNDLNFSQVIDYDSLKNQAKNQ
jgi:hypothetical protein